MPRAKDTKSIAKRIDLHYFKKPHPWRRARLALVVLAVVAAGGWVAYAVSRPDRGTFLYNPGPVTAAHASFENNCAACHDADGKGGFTRSVSDRACLQCHEAPAHADNQLLLTSATANRTSATGSVIALAREVPLSEFLDHPAPAAGGEGEKPAGAEASGEPAGGGATALSAGMPHSGGAVKTILISANCTECHFEHRGHAALAAVSNQHCTQCHQNLTPTLQDASKRQVAQNAITAFTASGHPSFGRQLAANAAQPTTAPSTAPAGESAPAGEATAAAAPADAGTAAGSPTAAASAPRWRDPTDVKFNHATHLSASVKEGVLIDNCTACHEPARPGASLAEEFGRRPGAPPFAARPDGGWQWPTRSDGRYMQPVNFERHCQQCHSLQLPSGVPVAHADMSVVRGQLRDLDGLHYAHLAGLSPQEREKTLGGQSADEWVKAQVTAVQRAVGGKLSSLALAMRNASGVPEAWQPLQTAEREQDRAALVRAMRDSKVQPMLARDPSVLEYFVAFQAQVACAKCHSMEGVVPAAYVSAVTGQKLAVNGLTPPAAQQAPAGAGAAPAGTESRPGGIRGPRRPSAPTGESTPEAQPQAQPEAQPQQPPASGGGIRRPRAPAAAAPDGGAGTEAQPQPQTQPPADSPPAQQDAPAAPRIRRPGRPSGAMRPASPDGLAFADPSAERAMSLLQIRRPGARRPETPPAEAPAETPAPTPPAGDAAAPPQPSGEQQPQAATPAAPAVPPAQRFAGVSMLHTKPTGIPKAPRRWFANGRFDHQAHRNLTCVDCHAGAATSASTADVLSPDFDGRMSGLPAKDGKPVTASTSCLSCHGADRPNLPAGLSACIVCHDFHQHQKEVWPAGRNVPRVKGGATPVKADPKPTEPATQPSEPARQTARAW